MRRMAWRTTLLTGLACLAVTACTQQVVAPGIVPEPQTGWIERRVQVPLAAEPADVAVIFIGGFSEQVLTHFRACYEQTPPLPVKGTQHRAFYAWDGGTGNIFFHSTWKLQRDLRAFLTVNPRADLVLIGHSYGGSAIMDALRHIGPVEGKVLVVTVDPVSCRERSKPRERAEEVDFWLNSYCSPYCSPKDLAAWVGGSWRHCEQADVNLVFSGEKRDKEGRRYQHAQPLPLLCEKPADGSKSAYEQLVDACHRLKVGR